MLQRFFLMGFGMDFVWVITVPSLSCSSSTPYSEEEAGWDTEIKDDVIEECNKHGGVIHIYVDKNSAQVCLVPMRCWIFPKLNLNFLKLLCSFCRMYVVPSCSQSLRVTPVRVWEQFCGAAVCSHGFPQPKLLWKYRLRSSDLFNSGIWLFCQAVHFPKARDFWFPPFLENTGFSTKDALLQQTRDVQWNVCLIHAWKRLCSLVMLKSCSGRRSA